ncbi:MULTISPECIES: LysR family transcriptional regulator [Apilactobacillus]|uniref:LysR family transcriptional regulator n=2 Tax=Apilactobacillus TaxID=2767877 RepID=A0A9Q8MUH7_9LACO|nr:MULTISPECIES: LysR family transcriptional regulator [Apilactobacillus]TPR13911.1 LysR family transcriptional regulator [Apilactobacillus timberlakei]TPR15226.1 LysR family transcriptional regulator [Apilactobacillus timberlakei]TPR17117.1 LysR family transcriptional regulator [Apilactobacillus timberlakei]TPR17520.1 LysR family transcriptional regulator [Apilactobacillus timberlakei]TPR20111.1 LysR family transcriptional regulator [Apilactobacillus timberlakei]
MKKTRQENIFSSKTLTYFLQLADTMNYTQAAQILGITQPALTQQIKKLEKTIGSPLFYSIGKKLKLSAAGNIMLKSTKEIYSILNETADEIEQSNSATSGEINIGVLSSIQDKVLEDFSIEMYKENPSLTINLRMLTRKEIWESLENNQIDLAIMYLPDSSIKNWKPYEAKKIISDDLMFIHHNKKLSNNSKVRFQDTIDTPWVTYPEGYFLDFILKEKFKNQLVDLPTSAARFTTPNQILKFALETGSNTALPSSFMIDKDVNKMENIDAWVSKMTPNIKFDLAFVYRKNKRLIPRIGNFLDQFDKFLEEKDYLSRLKEKD